MSSLRASRIVLRALVVYTGACVLVVEILATRILAPHFGSSLMTLSSVLGITLGALSIGYYAGGLLADRRPQWTVLGMLLSVSGVLTLLIWPLSFFCLQPLEMHLSVGTGALVASITLFLLPCAVLGTLSPYVIGLEQSLAPGMAAGRAAGNIFFWSTLGSIAGSIAAGFVLIPLLGVRAVIVGIGTSLLMLGCVIVMATASSKKAKGTALVLVIISACATAIPEPTQALFSAEGVYQRIAVHDMLLKGRPVRILWQDRNASSGIRLDSKDYAFDYTRVPAVAWTGRKAPEKSLVIGAGAFVIPDAIAASAPGAEVDVVDIEPRLEEIATTYFEHQPTSRVRSIVSDGRVWMRRGPRYDLIVADAYQATYAIPVHLTTEEFFALAKDRLSDDGVFVGNFIGSLDFSKKNYLPSAMRTLRSVFPKGRFYAITEPHTTELQNVMFVGCKADSCVDPCSAPLKKSPDPILSTLCSREISVNAQDLEGHVLLTDDYAPVEWLTHKS